MFVHFSKVNILFQFTFPFQKIRLSYKSGKFIIEWVKE